MNLNNIGLLVDSRGYCGGLGLVLKTLTFTRRSRSEQLRLRRRGSSTVLSRSQEFPSQRANNSLNLLHIM